MLRCDRSLQLVGGLLPRADLRRRAVRAVPTRRRSLHKQRAVLRGSSVRRYLGLLLVAIAGMLRDHPLLLRSDVRTERQLLHPEQPRLQHRRRLLRRSGLLGRSVLRGSRQGVHDSGRRPVLRPRRVRDRPHLLHAVARRLHHQFGLLFRNLHRRTMRVRARRRFVRGVDGLLRARRLQSRHVCANQLSYRQVAIWPTGGVGGGLQQLLHL